MKNLVRRGGNRTRTALAGQGILTRIPKVKSESLLCDSSPFRFDFNSFESVEDKGQSE